MNNSNKCDDDDDSDSDFGNSVQGVTIDWVPTPSTTVAESVVVITRSVVKCPSSLPSQEK